MNTIRSIAVFCGSSNGAKPIYQETARLFGNQMHQRQTTLVYGGGNRGLMGTVAESIHSLGGRVIGVIPEALNRSDICLRPVEEQLIVVPTMHERKATMYRLADAFVALPGGIGTFEEILEVYTWLQLGFHTKPVALLNVAGFFDCLLAFLQHSVQEGFLKADHLKALIVESDIDALFERLARFEGRLSDKLGR
jgi:uncharacterized protein (TIGR00730 family)